MATSHTHYESDFDTTNRQDEDAEALGIRLRQVGLKATRPRLPVFNLLRELGEHRSTDELIRELTRA